VNQYFVHVAKKRGFYSEQLMEEIAQSGSLKKIKTIPGDIRRLFVTALDISPEWHVKIQAAFQKYTDQAVSKTVNLPVNSTIADVEKAFMLAWKLRCKGITVYRYGSKPEQVLSIGGNGEKQAYISAEVDYAGGCPTPYCEWP
jgi:ribonucleoside-diphosphate reductase alpha chain